MSLINVTHRRSYILSIPVRIWTLCLFLIVLGGVSLVLAEPMPAVASSSTGKLSPADSGLAKPLAAITENSFTATPVSEGVAVSWETSPPGPFGFIITGFELYRATGEDGPYTQIGSFIPATGATSHAYLDRQDISFYTIYYYKLKVVYSSGLPTDHGPIAADGPVVPLPFSMMFASDSQFNWWRGDEDPGMVDYPDFESVCRKLHEDLAFEPLIQDCIKNKKKDFEDDFRKEKNIETNGNMVKAMNDIMDLDEWPDADEFASENPIGAGTDIKRPRGVIINGDLTDYWRPGQFELFEDIYYGNDDYPGLDPNYDFYPGLGNHDYSNNFEDCFYGLDSVGDLNRCAKRAVWWMADQIADEIPDIVNTDMSGYVRVTNAAGFAIRFKVDYEDINNNSQSSGWIDDPTGYTAPFVNIEKIPYGATDIKVTIELLDRSLTWTPLRTYEISRPTAKCYEASGTLFEEIPPQSKQVDCNPLDWPNGSKGSLSYSFDIENYHFVQLHNRPNYERTLKRKGDSTSFEVTQSYEWLTKDLQAANEAGKNIVINMHDVTEHIDLDGGDSPDTEITQFEEAISGTNVVAIFGGHVHQSYGQWESLKVDNNGKKVPVFLSGSAECERFLLVEFTPHYFDVGVIDASGGTPSFITDDEDVCDDTQDWKWDTNGADPTPKEYPVNPQPTVTIEVPQPDSDFPQGEDVLFKVAGFDPEGDTLTYKWDFGDGTTEESEDDNLTHAFANGGVYTVKVTVADSEGGEDTDTVQVMINNVPPTIDTFIVDPEPSDEGSPVTVSVTFSDPGGIKDTDSDSCTINYGDGTAPVTRTVTAVAGTDNQFTCTASHIYDDNPITTADIPIKVIVKDIDGASDQRSTVHTVLNVAPIVGPITLDHPPFLGLPVTASATFDDPGPNDTHTCTVDYGDGQLVGTIDGNTCTGPSHTYPNDTIFAVITIRVKDKDLHIGSNFSNHSPTDENTPPQVGALRVSTNPSNEGSSVGLFAEFSDDTAGTKTCTIDYGDGSGLHAGTVSRTSIGNDFICVRSSHKYANNGNYTIKMVVTDEGDAAGRSIIPHTVNNVAPTVNPPIVDPEPSNEGSSVIASATVSDPGSEDTYTCMVDYGDGSGAQAGFVNGKTCSGDEHTYTSKGNYEVTIVVTEVEDGGSGQNSSTHLVGKAPTVDPFTISPEPSNEGSSITETEVGFFADDSFGGATCTVDYGDGSEPQTINLPSTFTCRLPAHTYADNGDYEIIVVITDKIGLSGQRSTIHTVNNIAPRANAGPDQLYNDGEEITLRGSFSDPGSDDEHDFRWRLLNSTSGQEIPDINSQAFTFTPLDRGDYTFEFRVDDGDGGVDTDTVNIKFRKTDLMVTKTATPDPVLLGDPLVYTLTVHNLGPNLAENVAVTDFLPTDVTFSQLVGFPDQGSCTQGSVIVACNLGNLAVGDSVEIIFEVTPTQAGLITNQAEVTMDTPDSNPSNNNASHDILACDFTLTASDETSLNVAIACANNAGPGTHTINVTSNILLTGSTTPIDNPAATEIIVNGGGFTVDGNDLGRVFQIKANTTVSMSDITVTGGQTERFENGGGLHNLGDLTLVNSTVKSNWADSNGGGIYNTGQLTLINSTLSDNSSLLGGGIYNPLGEVTLINSTLNDNNADFGGGIYNTGDLTLINSTLSHNESAFAAGIFNLGGAVSVINSTFNNNIAHVPSNPVLGASIAGGPVTLVNSIVRSSGADCSGTITADEHNLASDGSCGNASTGDPLLGPLQDNGGPTWTHALLSGSPAIDAGDNAVCLAAPVNDLDQRGITRSLQGLACDLGAFERGITAPIVDTPTFGPEPSSEGNPAIVSATFSDLGPNDTHTCSVDYGDGSGVATGIVNGNTCSGPSYSYADNGDYQVTVTVTDKDGASGQNSTIHTVNNIAPTVNAGGDQAVKAGETVFLDPATFNDRGTLDTHTASIDWGDGTALDVGVVTESPFGPPGDSAGANGIVAGSHVYAETGDYTVNVCVTDDDGAETCDSLTLAPPSMTTLIVHPLTSDGSSVTFVFGLVDEPSALSALDETAVLNLLAETSATATFECQLDSGGFSPCTSPKTYTNLAPGPHVFEVRSVDEAGNVDPIPATHDWSVAGDLPPTCKILAVHDRIRRDSQLFTIDFTTLIETISPLGPEHPGADIEGLGLDPVSGIYYGASALDDLADSILYQIDIDGNMVQVGPIVDENGNGFREVASLAFHPDGTLWAFANRGDPNRQGLITINTATGVATLVKQVEDNFEGLAWNPAGDTLWLANRGQTLYQYTPGGDIGRVHIISDLPGPIEGLEFRPDGLLLVGLHHGGAINIYTIDVTTGQIVTADGLNTHQFEDVESLIWPAGCSATILDPETAIPGAESLLSYSDSLGNALKITVPSGAINETTTLAYTQLNISYSGLTNLNFANQAFRVNAYRDGLHQEQADFNQAVTFRLEYNETNLAGLDENSLNLYYWDRNQNQWREAACGEIERHPDENWLAVPICHLTEFALFAAERPPTEIYLPIITRSE